MHFVSESESEFITGFFSGYRPREGQPHGHRLTSRRVEKLPMQVWWR
jgi:truncated hemoglobin YjbI